MGYPTFRQSQEIFGYDHPKTGWWFGTFLYVSHHIGNVITPTDELHDFSER
jgi:hypothetical protein